MPQRQRARDVKLVAAIALSTALAACTADLPIPDDAQLDCSASACPTGWTCTASKRCVPSSAIDVKPPSISGVPVVDPPASKAGVSPRITFTVTEALSQEPVLRAEVGTTRLLTRISGQSPGLDYVYEYASQGDEPQGTDCPVTVDLVDTQGVTSTGLAAGALRFDDVPPFAIARSVDGSPAKVGSTVTVEFIATEPLGADPVVRAAGTYAFTKDPSSSGQDYVYVRVSDGTEPETQGGLPVTADLLDVAGNTATVDLAPVTFDRTPPGLASGPDVSPLAAAVGTLVKVTFTADEDLGADPVVTLGGVAMDKGAQAGRLYTYGHVADPADGQGAKALAVSLTDVAGNLSGPISGPSVTLDFTPPSVGALAACADDGTTAPCSGVAPPFSAQPGHDRVKLTFTLSEPGPRPVVSIAGAVLGDTGPDSCQSANGLAWTCTSTVVDAAGGASPRVLSVTAGVTAADAAGNSSFAFALLTFDFRPPGLAGTPYFERCDAYAPARVAANDLWVKPVASFSGPGCPFSACGVSGPVRVQLTLDEPVTLGAGGIALDDGTPLQVEACASDASQIVAVLGTDGAPGTRTVLANVVDAAGNARQLALGTLRLDATPPLAPDTLTSGRIVYDRFPWGADATSGAKASFLRGVAGSVAAGASVVAYDGPVPATAAAVGRTTADATGAFGAAPGAPGAFSLVAGDVPEIFVVQEDPAGNASPAAIVWDGSWTATTGFKQAGSTNVNPNLFTVEPAFREPRDTSAQLEPADPTLAAAVTGPGVVTTGEPDARVVTSADAVPSARGLCAMGYDPDLARTVLFGGQAYVHAVGTLLSLDTWAWDGASWSQLATPDQPAARSAAGLAYDGARRRFVLFGGNGAAAPLGDTWELDGTAWRRACWPGCTSAQCTCTAMPSPRAGAALFFDPVTGRVLLAGGADASGPRDDFWSWDGQSWTPLAISPRPPAQSGARVAVSPDLGQVMLVVAAGTWIWDGAAWTGSATTPPTGPSGQLFWDPGDQRFHSLFMPTGYLSTWNGASWDGPVVLPVVGDLSAVNTADGSCGAFDRERGAFVEFGGCIDGGQCGAGGGGFEIGATFLARHDQLRQTIPGVGPDPRAGAVMADFAPDGTAWLYGGRGVPRYPYADNWTWDGTAWRGDGAGSPITGTYDASMASLGTRLVRMFGDVTGGGTSPGVGYPPDTMVHQSPGFGWTLWSGDFTYYTEPVDTAAAGYPHAHQAIATDVGAGKAIFFRSPVGAPTWSVRWVDTWDPWFMHGDTAGMLWEPVTTAVTVPASVRGHRMTSCAGHVVLFGGVDAAGGFRDDTYVWSGADWVLQQPAARPPARSEHAMFCDDNRGKVYVVGGLDAAGDRDDVWEWDGVTWRERAPAERPTPRHGAAATWHSGGGSAVLFGGLGNGFQGDTWIWDGGRDRRPAHLLHARFADSGAADSTLLSVGATFWSGASAFTPAGAAQPGVQLLVRDRGIWRPASTPNAAPATSPARVTYSTASDAEWTAPGAASHLRRLMAGDDLTVTFAVEPLGTNRDREPGASLATRYAEVNVRYRLACLPPGRATTSAQRCCSGVKAGNLCQ